MRLLGQMLSWDCHRDVRAPDRPGADHPEQHPAFLMSGTTRCSSSSAFVCARFIFRLRAEGCAK
jgi:hypothetical protein